MALHAAVSTSIENINGVRVFLVACMLLCAEGFYYTILIFNCVAVSVDHKMRHSFSKHFSPRQCTFPLSLQYEEIGNVQLSASILDAIQSKNALNLL